jgi:hypothetical protein
MTPRAVATTMMMMTRINPCGDNDNATMTTYINPLCTTMMMINKPSRVMTIRGNEDTTVLEVGGAMGTV